MSQKILKFCSQYCTLKSLMLYRGLNTEPLSSDSKKKKYSLYFLQFCANISLIYFFAQSVYLLLSIDFNDINDIKKKLLHISYFFKCSTNLLTFAYFQINFRSVCELLEDINSRLSPSEKKESNRRGLAFFIAWTVTVLITDVSYLIFLFYQNEFSFKNCIENFIWDIYSFGWVIAAHFLYLLICFKIYLMEIRLDATEPESRRSRAVRNGEESFKTKIDFVIEFKNSVNSNLSFLPFMWFFDCFQKTCIHLTYLTVNELPHTWIERIVPYFEYSVLIIYFLFFVTFMINIRSRRLGHHHLLRHVDQINASPQTRFLFHDYLHITESIRIYSNIDYEGWGVIALNKSYVLAHLSFTISFSVMMSQLIDQLIKKNSPV